MNTKSTLSHKASAVGALLAVMMLAGCSSAEPKPDDAMVRAKTAVDQATTAGSAQYAAMDLNNAQTKLQTANQAEVKGDYKQARYMAEDAEADAGLALAKTQAAKAAESAKQVQQGNQVLQDQVNTPNNPPSL
jgi:uncharacterized protein YcfL